MFLNLTIASRGKYAIMATVIGSCGETAYAQVSKAYINPEAAAKRAERLSHDPKYKDVTLKNVDTGRVYYFEPQWRPRASDPASCALLAKPCSTSISEAVSNVTGSYDTSTFVQRVVRMAPGTVASWGITNTDLTPRL